MFNIFSIFPKIYVENIFASSLEEKYYLIPSKLSVLQEDIKMDTIDT